MRLFRGVGAVVSPVSISRNETFGRIVSTDLKVRIVCTEVVLPERWRVRRVGRYEAFPREAGAGRLLERLRSYRRSALKWWTREMEQADRFARLKIAVDRAANE